MVFWFFLISERAKIPETQGVNEVRKNCFGEQIQRAIKKIVIILLTSFKLFWKSYVLIV